MSQGSPYLPFLLLFTLALIWGTSFILIKQGLAVFDPEVVGALRISAAAISFLPFAITHLKGLGRHHIKRLFLSGMLGIFFPAFLFALAQTRLASSVTGIANSLTPLLTLLVGVLFFQQPFRKAAGIGIAVGLAGTLLLIFTNGDGVTAEVNGYLFFILIACLCYAVNLNYIKYNLSDLKSLTITGGSIVLIGPLSLVILFGATDFVGDLRTEQGAWKAFGYVTLLGLMSTAVATFIFNKLVKISSPLFTSSVTYLIPLVAVGWGVLDGEQLYTGHYAGMAAIITGVFLANKAR